MTIGESSDEQIGELSIESREENPQEPNTQSSARQPSNNPGEPMRDHPYAERSTPYLVGSPEEGGHPRPGKGT